MQARNIAIVAVIALAAAALVYFFRSKITKPADNASGGSTSGGAASGGNTDTSGGQTSPPASSGGFFDWFNGVFAKPSEPAQDEPASGGSVVPPPPNPISGIIDTVTNAITGTRTAKWGEVRAEITELEPVGTAVRVKTRVTSGVSDAKITFYLIAAVRDESGFEINNAYQKLTLAPKEVQTPEFYLQAATGKISVILLAWDSLSDPKRQAVSVKSQDEVYLS